MQLLKPFAHLVRSSSVPISPANRSYAPTSFTIISICLKGRQPYLRVFWDAEVSFSSSVSLTLSNDVLLFHSLDYDSSRLMWSKGIFVGSLLSASITRRSTSEIGKLSVESNSKFSDGCIAEDFFF